MAFDPIPAFTRGIFVRILLLFLLLLLCAWSIAADLPVLAAVLAGGAAIGTVAELLHHLHRSHRAFARFFDAVRYDDFAQSFRGLGRGSGLDHLGRSLEAAMARFRERRAGQEEQVRYYKAVVEHAPLPILSISPEGKLALLNHAARRFFTGRQPVRIDDLERFGHGLKETLEGMRAGEQRILRFRSDIGERRVAATVAEVTTTSGRQRLVTLQNISGALEETEYRAWQQLVRVLTHEIMNSLTPVTSLAESAAGLIERAQRDPEALPDAREAVETVARRSAALMQFVDSYRALSKLPPPQRRRLELSEIFDRLRRLAESDWAKSGVEVEISPPAGGLAVEADPDQIEQALLNLLGNAREAVGEMDEARVRLGAYRNPQGRVVVQIADSGPGVAEDIAEDIFLPFFTTKRGGTGIGLALVRQIMLNHGGRISVNPSTDLGGACFSLMF